LQKGLWSITPAAQYATALQLIDQMQKTRMPQLLLAQVVQRLSEDGVSGHALVVYKYENDASGSGGTFYLYDSNYPGESITVKWHPLLGFHDLSKYISIYGALYDTPLSFVDYKDFENLYQGAEAGWPSSKYKTISVTSPSLDSTDTAIVSDPDNLIISGKVTGGQSEAKYMWAVLNGDHTTKVPVSLNADGSFVLPPLKLPNPENRVWLIASINSRNFEVDAGFKEILIKVKGQEFFSNPGFETGSFDGWNHETHTWGNQTPGSFTPEKSSIVGTGKDPISGLERVYQGQYAVMVNNADNDYHISSVSQAAVVPQNLTTPEWKFCWSAVLQDPNHSAADQPYVDITAVDDNNGDILYSKHFYSNDPTYPGWQTTTYNGATWRIIPWQVVIIDVSQRRGHSISLKVTAADCALGGHGGYVYFDAYE
jgi:hypothetical protein